MFWQRVCQMEGLQEIRHGVARLLEEECEFGVGLGTESVDKGCIDLIMPTHCFCDGDSEGSVFGNGGEVVTMGGEVVRRIRWCL